MQIKYIYYIGIYLYIFLFCRKLRKHTRAVSGVAGHRIELLLRAKPIGKETAERCHLADNNNNADDDDGSLFEFSVFSQSQVEWCEWALFKTKNTFLVFTIHHIACHNLILDLTNSIDWVNNQATDSHAQTHTRLLLHFHCQVGDIESIHRIMFAWEEEEADYLMSFSIIDGAAMALAARRIDFSSWHILRQQRFIYIIVIYNWEFKSNVVWAAAVFHGKWIELCLNKLIDCRMIMTPNWLSGGVDDSIICACDGVNRELLFSFRANNSLF